MLSEKKLEHIMLDAHLTWLNERSSEQVPWSVAAAHAIAEKLAKGVVWQEKFQLDEMGYLNILARTGPVLDEPDERGIWFENNVKPNALVELTVTVTKEE